VAQLDYLLLPVRRLLLVCPQSFFRLVNLHIQLLPELVAEVALAQLFLELVGRPNEEGGLFAELPELLVVEFGLLPDFVEVGHEVAEEGLGVVFGVGEVDDSGDVLAGDMVISVFVEPVEDELDDGVCVHEAEGGNACDVLLKEEFTGGLAGDDGEEALEVGQFGVVRVALVQAGSDVVEREVGLGGLLEGAEAGVEMDDFLPLQAELTGQTLQLLALELGGGVGRGLLREAEPHHPAASLCSIIT